MTVMRTLLITSLGMLLAILSQYLAPASGRGIAAVVFTLLWLAVAALNLHTGLSHGYTLAEELPLHAVLFGAPALASWISWWLLTR